MEILGIRRQVPIVLLTGFLGSGKTTLLKEMMQALNKESKKVAVIQNEFANNSIDGDLLKDAGLEFELRELNTGSIFCACLFGQFKVVLKDLANRQTLDFVIVEATGIADPIAVAQLLEDKDIAKHYYLSKIISMVDAPRFTNVLSRITGVRNQIKVADLVIVNKIEQVAESQLNKVKEEISKVNPLVNIIYTSYAEISDFNSLELASRSSNNKHISNAELTKCGEGNYQTKCFKTTNAISKKQLESFCLSLTDDILRVKGYVMLDDGCCYVMQFVPGQVNLAPIDEKARKTELVSIGYDIPEFELLIN